MIIVRSAVMDDASGLKLAIEDAYAIYQGRGLNLPSVSDGIAEAIADTPVFVADQDGMIIGGLILRLRTSAQIENIAVTQGGMGKGVGKALIGRAEDEARARGYTQLALATHQDLTENLHYYARLGWHEVERDGMKVLMDKHLGVPNRTGTS